MQKEIQKFSNSEIMEGMSSISSLIDAMEHSELQNDRRILRVMIDAAKKRSKAREISFLNAKARSLGFSVEYLDASEIDALAVGTTHGGILAECTPRNLPKLSADAILADGIYYYLEGVEDPYNFGYAVRSLYAAGADGVVIPPRNWMGAAGVVARSSAGCSERIPMLVADTPDAIACFHSLGYTVICAGIRDSVSLWDIDLQKPLLVILGGEKRGISKAALEASDHIVRIDYGTEFRGSLSTSAAAAVFGFEILRQNRKR